MTHYLSGQGACVNVAKTSIFVLQLLKSLNVFSEVVQQVPVVMLPHYAAHGKNSHGQSVYQN